jgi:amino acid transporter
MAKDDLFWSPMKRVNSRYGTPVLALVFASILTMIIQILIPSFPPVALLASITTLIPYAAVSVSLPILRRTKPDVDRPFKLPAGTLLALLGFVLSTVLVYWASWPWTIVGGILTLVGFPLFLLIKEHRFEWRKSGWIWVYVIGIILISLLGDTNFVFDNFLPIGPMNILVMPYDLVVLIIFSILIFYWAYKSNVGPK